MSDIIFFVANFIACILKLGNKRLTKLIYEERTFTCLVNTNHMRLQLIISKTES